MSQQSRLAAAQLAERMLSQRETGLEGEALEEWHDKVDAMLARFVGGSDDDAVIPNLVMLQSEANRLSALRGNDVKKYVYGLNDMFEKLSKVKTDDEFAEILLDHGLTAITEEMGYQVFMALKTGVAETLQMAIAIAIATIPEEVILAIAIALVVIIAFLLIFMSTKQMLGLVINDTNVNYVVPGWRTSMNGYKEGQLYMAHGQMRSFPEDKSPTLAGNPTLQIGARFFDAPGSEKNMVSAGLYYGSKNFGTNGTEGLIVLSAIQGESGPVIAHEFNCPYSHDNGADIKQLVSIPNGKKEMKKVYDDMNSRPLNTSTTIEYAGRSYAIGTSVSAPRGGSPALIAYIGLQD